MPARSHDGDLDDEFDDEVTSATPAGRMSIGDRIRARHYPAGNATPTSNARSGTARPATPRPAGQTARQSTKQIVERLDDRERRLCFAASGLAAVAGVLIYVVETENKHFRLTKGQLTPQTTLIVGLVVAALLLGATLLGRRAPVGFVALFAFLAFGTQYFAGIPFLVLAVWLLVRSYKFQKEAAAARKAAMADGSSTARGGMNGSRGTRGARGSSGSTTAGKSGSARSSSRGPSAEANKRYTPKRPAPPPPKPSRRERKATQASD